MPSSSRVLFALLLVLAPIAMTGCFYHDYDIETVDHYSHYGHSHSVDVTQYHSDGCDY